MHYLTNYAIKLRKRIQLVHIAANELGILDPKRHETDPDDEYHLILRRWNRPGTKQPVTSSTQMSYQQLGELLAFMKALGFKLRPRRESRPSPHPSSHERRGRDWKKYPSSMQGLRDEIRDLAEKRWGESWERSLIALCRKFGVSHWRFLDMNHAKAVKQRLITWEASDDGQGEQGPVGEPGEKRGAGSGAEVLRGDE